MPLTQITTVFPIFSNMRLGATSTGIEQLVVAGICHHGIDYLAVDIQPVAKDAADVTLHLLADNSLTGGLVVWRDGNLVEWRHALSGRLGGEHAGSACCVDPLGTHQQLFAIFFG